MLIIFLSKSTKCQYGPLCLHATPNTSCFYLEAERGDLSFKQILKASGKQKNSNKWFIKY